MPLVIIAGYPCSGKSTVAAVVEKAVRDAGGDVQLISENDLFSDRNKCYDSATLRCLLLGLKVDSGACPREYHLTKTGFSTCLRSHHCSSCGGEEHASAHTIRDGQAPQQVDHCHSGRTQLCERLPIRALVPCAGCWYKVLRPTGRHTRRHL